MTRKHLHHFEDYLLNYLRIDNNTQSGHFCTELLSDAMSKIDMPLNGELAAKFYGPFCDMFAKDYAEIYYEISPNWTAV